MARPRPVNRKFYLFKKGKMKQSKILSGPVKKGLFNKARTSLSQIYNIYQGWLDKLTPHVILRWTFAVLINVLFILRILVKQGWYSIAYYLEIFHLYLFVEFLTPLYRSDSTFEFDDTYGPQLPITSDEEFRPFIRRLPEFFLWYFLCISTFIALLCTSFDFFNHPENLLWYAMYFVIIVCIAIWRQVKHMRKYQYLPFTHGKPKYQNNIIMR